MKVQQIMSHDVRVVGPEDSVRDAARLMDEIEAGILPVAERDRLIGMLSDRDIAIRGIAQGLGPDAKVREIMTRDVRYCYEDEDITHISANMAEQQVRRLPVVDRSKRLVGIVSLGDLAHSLPSGQTGAALRGISQPGGPHS
jgi:CBS domain-containing protein